MTYEVVMPYHLHMPSYFLGTFTEYPWKRKETEIHLLSVSFQARNYTDFTEKDKINPCNSVPERNHQVYLNTLLLNIKVTTCNFSEQSF